MKKIIVSMIALAMLAVTPASAIGFNFGVKGGLNSSKLHSDLDGFKADSGYGWFIGPTLKVNILPFLGVQGSAFYSQNKSEVNGESIKQKNILIPLDARLNFQLPASTGLFISTGPQFGFNVGDKNFNPFSSAGRNNAGDTFQLKKSSFYWNFGAGVTLLKKLEVGFVYSLGLGKTADVKNSTDVTNTIKDDNAKSRGWMVSAAYFF